MGSESKGAFGGLSAVALLVAVLGAASCGDEVIYIGGNGVDAGFADGVTFPDSGSDGQTGPDGAAVDIPAGQLPQLNFVWLVGDDDISCENGVRCAVNLSYNSDRLLEVRYHRGDLNLVSQPVKWAIEDDPNQIGGLATGLSYTDSDGLASVLVASTVALIGIFTVKAYVDSPGVTPLFFDVTVSPKGIIPLTVLTEYPEPQLQNLTQYEVRLYRQASVGGPPDCSDLQALYDGQADQQGPPTLIGQTTKFPIFDGLEADGVQYYTVLAYALDNNYNVLAWGCNDGEADVTLGQSRTVVVDLRDVPPDYRGTYKVRSFFDFVTLLPESVQPYIYILLDLFESPVGGLLSLTCTIGGGVLDDFCKLIFNDTANPDIDDLTAIGGFAVDLMDAIIAGFAQGTAWGDVMAGGADISEMLQNLEIQAEIQFKEQPDSNNHWTADKTYENWHTVIVKWSLGQNCNPFTDENCGKQTFSVADIQSELVLGSFEAEVANFWDLTIQMHPLNLKYGALINFIVENQLLQMLMPSAPGEPIVDSYEEFIQVLLAGKECLDPTFGMTCCAKFADDLVGQGAIIGASTIESLCEALTTLGANFIRDQLTSLDTDTGDAMQIGTLVPCKFFDADGDRVVDGFGDENQPCTWDVNFELFGLASDLEAKFWGVRF